jgi:NADPH:quinone reductase-like Zn-dependent oxidoreductase
MSATMTTTGTAKAVRIHAFGGPDVLRLEEVPRPEPKAGQVLIRVYAAGVNPVDWKIREGSLGRVPLPAIMGSDFSGVVETLGPGVEEFRVEEAVFGSVADESGSYAEYAVAPVAQIVQKPDAIDHLHAAALPIAGLTAWQALMDTAGLKPGQKVLIHAAAGGVGHLAVQFAKWKGARVIGTASASHADFLKELGVDQFIDYHTTRFEDAVGGVDVVLDTIGSDTQERSWQVLKRGGVLVSIVQLPPKQRNGARGVFIRASHKRVDELATLAGLLAEGKIQVRVERELPLHEARKAQELSQRGHVNGKIVLRVSHE